MRKTNKKNTLNNTSKHKKNQTMFKDIERSGDNVIVKKESINTVEHKMNGKSEYFVRFKGHEDNLVPYANLHLAREGAKGEYVAVVKPETPKHNDVKDSNDVGAVIIDVIEEVDVIMTV